MLRKFLSVLVLVFSVHFAFGQVGTGTYPHGTFDNKGFDAINVGNLNVHFSIPILNKPGRGLPFYYNLSFDSSVWYPATVSGSQTWTPVQNFGWKGDTELATGYVSYSSGGNHFESEDGWMNRYATQRNAPHPPRNAYREGLSLSALALLHDLRSPLRVDLLRS
jgi:hypothetical protein